MYHQLNKFTGRLAPAVNLQSPLFPLSPAVLAKVDVPNIIYTAAHLATVSDEQLLATSKKYISGTNQYYSTLPENIRKKQALFQKDNDLPVYLKGGTSDVILFRLTVALILVGLIGVADLIYTMAVPKKQ